MIANMCYDRNMKTYTEVLNQNQIKLLYTTYIEQINDKKLPHVQFQIKLEDCTITVYNSNKVVYQGINADKYLQNQIEIDEEAGSDEVGTGDYFGPVVVCAAYLSKEDIALAKELKVNDSKQISDDMIRKIAPILMNQVKYSLLILDNIKYNKIHDSNNMNQIKARLHNQAYIHLKNKVGYLPKRCVVDQFTPENLYYNYIKHEPTIIKELTFETKAESKYLSVAVASMIARYAFLVAWDKMEAYYECSIPKGAGAEVDVFASNFVKKHGFDELAKIAKMHFKNTEKIKE